MNVPTYLLLNQTMSHTAIQYNSTRSKNRFVDFHDSGYSPPKAYIGINGYPMNKSFKHTNGLTEKVSIGEPMKRSYRLFIIELQLM